MKALTLLLVPAALIAGQTRYARLGEFQGTVEVQLTAADAWMPAERNLPLAESTWVRTGPGARVEIELDDGSAWRLGPESLGEISDYTQLSTGQRVTLLSLDHGTAYFSGEPLGNDVLMLVAPGAQATLGQGARVRVTAAADWSQFSVLEGMVRFSSPQAEMGLREGQSARVEPANPQHFYLYPQVTALPLDQWSEDRDKAEAAPVSAARVTWRHGLADLDTAGEWIRTEDLDMVWKPRVTEGWAPYQKGRWRYYEALGYAWVSDDSWGWVPYHSGRWAHRDDAGWVWQPAVSTAFKPGEVYWLRGTNMAGWGPLAPGELWTSATPGATPPRYLAAGITSFAAFQQDVRVIDPKGFAAPSPEQLQAAVYARALPSPGFIAARLDATRPILKVGRTRIDPIVPGVTLTDTPPPPDPAMTSPPDDPQPPGSVAADAPPTMPPPPDGVYPVPVVALPVVEVPVLVSAPDHPSYSRTTPTGQTGTTSSQQTKQTQTNATSTSAQASQTVRNSGSQPVHEHAQTGTQNPPAASPTVRPPADQQAHEHPTATPPPSATPREPPRVQVPKVDPPKSTDKKSSLMTPGERGIYQQVLADFNVLVPNLGKSIQDLDAWARDYPNSDLANERQYYYVQAYNGLGRPDKVLEAATRPVTAGARATYRNPEQILQLLLVTTASLQRLSEPSPQQLATGQTAARQLLDYLPEYFAPQHKPESVNDGSWQMARTQIEGLGKLALARQAAPLHAGK
ncbi:MAG: DUF6600 domain-containing protein [Bryobacteraceae bacterium]|jgi:hypothetical protein